MRTAALLLAFLLVGPSVSAQENCSNAIDDDGDGLVDLNDTADCNCSLPASTTSLLPNPSLERFDGGQSGCASVQPGGLPAGTNQANCLTDWQRASLGTTDAWNAFTFTGAGPDFPTTLPQPLPSGSGVAGFWVGIRDEIDHTFYNGDGSTTRQYREYLATCLADGQRMVSGKDYRLTFALGFMDPQTSPGEDGPISIASPDSVELALYGIRRCEQLYFGPFYSCPETAGAEGYELIGTVTVSGTAGRWTSVSHNFTAAGTYEAFAIGGSCAADQGRPDGGLYRNYYFIDDLILNTTDAFTPVVAGPVQVDGLTVCDDITLTGRPQHDASYQWYRDGIALAGATTYSLALSGYPEVDGTYTLRITTPAGCAVTDPVVVQRPVVSDLFADTLGLCSSGDTLTIKPRRQTGATFQWSDGSTGASLAVATPGTYVVTVTEACVTHVETITIAAQAPLTYTLEQLPVGCTTDSLAVRVLTNAHRPDISFRSFPEEARLSHRDGVVTLTTGSTPAVLAFIDNGCTRVLDTLWLTLPVLPADCTEVAEEEVAEEKVPEKTEEEKDEKPQDEVVPTVIGEMPRVYAPNAFSPNGDGRNDRFTLYYNNLVVGITQLLVYDRWGELVWQQTSGEDTGWDGTFRGKMLSDGVYIYAARVLLSNGAQQSVTGSVTLVN